jgi:hypothetical protein
LSKNIKNLTIFDEKMAFFSEKFEKNGHFLLKKYEILVKNFFKKFGQKHKGGDY